MSSLVNRDEAPLTIGLTIFNPSVREDRHGNKVSDIMFPDFTYNMVHHPAKSWHRESGNIYKGRDCFVRFSAFRSDSDTVADTATIFTALGDFRTSWGDGDNLGYTYPEIIDNNGNLRDIAKNVSKQLRASHDDGEATFILLTMWLLHAMKDYSDPSICNFWLDKEAWEAKKKVLEQERNARRLSVRR